MNASAARLCLSICPALIVVTWGFLPRSADAPLLMVPLVMFGLECRRFGWTMAAVILITAAVRICWGAVLLGTAVGEIL